MYTNKVGKDPEKVQTRLLSRDVTNALLARDADAYRGIHYLTL